MVIIACIFRQGWVPDVGPGGRHDSKDVSNTRYLQVEATGKKSDEEKRTFRADHNQKLSQLRKFHELQQG